MKNKKIIRYLTEYNEWRRGGEGEQPNPINLWMIIEKAIKKLESHDQEVKDLDAKLALSESIVDAGVSELRFANSQTMMFYDTLTEIECITSDKLTKKAVGIARECYELNKLTHARDIFGSHPQWLPDIF